MSFINELNILRTPPKKRLSWNSSTTVHVVSPSFHDGPGPGCSSTPSAKKQPSPNPNHASAKKSKARNKVSHNGSSSFNSSSSQAWNVTWSSKSSKSCSEASRGTGGNLDSTDPSWDQTISNTASDGTVTVNLEFPFGGWDEESSDGNSSCSLEIVESEVESNPSPIKRGRKRKQSEVSEEDNAVLSGMGEEIERQLEAKAERNRLTVPNVKNILKSVITNPHVLAMVRRSMKSGSVAVSGDLDDFTYEPIITRAKAKQLLDSVPDMPWVGTPAKKALPSSECQVLIDQELADDSSDEEYRPGEEEPSDYEYSERDGSERGSERDISLEQSPAPFDVDPEQPPTPSSPKPCISDSATQTNWSEDGVFKVPQAPQESQVEQMKEENIALRTRSKLPLNDTPLEEIEQAFIPPDITPDLYDTTTTCDNADWHEFLKEFTQPLRHEQDSQIHDDEEEDPEYNVLAEEEIIDKEELRMDRAVKVSKRELNELMRELFEYTENFSSDDEDKVGNKSKSSASSSYGTMQGNNNSSPISFSEEMAIFEAFVSAGFQTPLGSKTNPQNTPRVTPASTPGLHTPVPPFASASPNGTAGGSSGKKSPFNMGWIADKNKGFSAFGTDNCQEEQMSYYSPVLKGCELNTTCSPGKLLVPASSAGKDNFSAGKGKSVNGDGSQVGDDNVSLNNSQHQSSVSSNLFFSPGKDYFFRDRSSGTNFYQEGEYIERSQVSKECWPSMESENAAFLAPDSAYLGNNTTPEPSQVLSKGDSKPTTPIRVQVPGPSDKSFYEDLPPPVRASPTVTLFEPSGNVSTTSSGDLKLDDCVLISAPQRLLLDQQMRQHVQLLTQHFLQTYQHPTLSDHAAGCKEQLVNLKYLGEGRKDSAFVAANLDPALQIVNEWEAKLNSWSGVQIKKEMLREVSKAKSRKNWRMKYVAHFPRQLMTLMGNSKAFIYPLLLPPMPFRTDICNNTLFVPSENHLIAIGLEQFLEYIYEHHEDLPQKQTCRTAMSYLCEYLIPTKKVEQLYFHVKKLRPIDGTPVHYYFKHSRAPPTTHFVVPFQRNSMKMLREHPHQSLPPQWRDFFYPAVQRR